MRVWAMLNEAAIRKSVGERREEADGDDARRLATWNETKKQLWEGLPEANRCAYEKLAEKWAMEGPDEAVKPMYVDRVTLICLYDLTSASQVWRRSALRRGCVPSPACSGYNATWRCSCTACTRTRMVSFTL